jgi:exopolysaccharide biosynthesis protein
MISTDWRARLTGAACCSIVAGCAAGFLALHQPLARPARAASRKPLRKVAAKAPAKATKTRLTPKRAVRRTNEPAISHRKVTVSGVTMNVVVVDPRRPGVRFGVATAGSGLGYRDQWSGMISRTKPAAAVTGTYFCTTTSLPVGLIQVNGRTIYQGGIGTAIAFRKGRAVMRTGKPGIAQHWAGYDTVLRAGPRLVTGGKRTLYPRAEGFKDPAIFARKPRTAVAIKKNGKVLLVTVQKPVLLRTLADALRKLGAVDAMCLDGGGSTGLYYRGKSYAKPNRPLTNLLVVYDSKLRYRQYAGKLNPNGPRYVRAGSGAG